MGQRSIRCDAGETEEYQSSHPILMASQTPKKKKKVLSTCDIFSLQHLRGNVGLLFTNKAADDVKEWFQKYSCQDFANAGFVALREETLPEGPLTQFTHSMEPQLRKLGLPTVLKKGMTYIDGTSEGHILGEACIGKGHFRSQEYIHCQREQLFDCTFPPKMPENVLKVFFPMVINYFEAY